ncbi:hypothetical protein [Vineibacter terrae]|uniref:hypothetical protein n=1 Tax=Vineibacter terrae TaxID=2586908 RepID=UPI002E3163D1|nr:hypothetical protein [Vineibacter terrae]HEX2886806.1 hypothetical protein [Vineibacter terrae]
MSRQTPFEPRPWSIQFEIYMPVEWGFGREPSDGMGGPPVEDAGTLYVRAYNTETEQDFLVVETTLADVLDEVLDIHTEVEGSLTDEGVEVARAVRQALLKEVQRISAAIERQAGET